MRRTLLLCALLLLLPLWAHAEAPAQSLTEFTAAFYAHADRLETEFEIACDPKVLEQLWEDSLVEGRSLLTQIKGDSGILSLTYSQRSHSITFSKCRYYNGLRILHAWRAGDTSFLTEREVQTLQAAQEIVAGVSGTELERERQLHDALCARVTYYTTDLPGFQDHDCAIGALLDGKADCDGYADAFCLLCNMAGLPARCVHGSTVPRNKEQADLSAQKKDVSHAWNAVQVNGKWVMVDVTWDDSDKETSYLYYNSGQDRHLQTHIWDDRALPFTVEASAGNELRPAELRRYTVTNWDELYPLMRVAAQARARLLCLDYPESFDLYLQSSALSDCVYAMGIVDYQWGFGGRCAEVHALQYADHFRICDTAADALDYIDECARRNIHSFSIYLYPPLSQQLFANDHQPLLSLLAQSRLERLYYRYSEASGRVIIEDADFLPRFPYLNSQGEIEAYLRDQARLHSASIIFWTPQSLAGDALSSVLYGMGVQGYSTTENLGRYILSDIVYYPEFCVVASRQELTDYLARCRSGRVNAFRFYCPQVLFASLLNDSGSELFDLLRAAGLRGQKVSYNTSYLMIEITEAVW